MGILSGLIGNASVESNESLMEKYGNLLVDGEQVDIGFKLIRDIFIFTNKRLILIDFQGMTGKKIEYQSVLYSSISRFSVETVGHFDLDAELKIWISSEVIPTVSKRFNSSVNIYDVQKVLANHVLR